MEGVFDASFTGSAQPRASPRATAATLDPDTLPPPFAGRPWAAEDGVTLPETALQVPTMLSAEEARLLHWLARDHATGAGAICDLGCFAGGSTAHLASGAAAAGHGAAIHAFDHFTISEPLKETHLYPAGIEVFSGNNMLHAVRHFLAPWADRLHLHPGDITRNGWQGGPIEILFIDAAKLPRTADRIAADFFPHLIPGKSVVVHQDYFHWRQPWVAAQLELLSDQLEIVGWCRKGSVVARATAALTSEAIGAASTARLDDDALIALLTRALRRFPGAPMRQHLARAILGVRDNPGVRVPRRMNPDGMTRERIVSVIDAAIEGGAAAA